MSREKKKRFRRRRVEARAPWPKPSACERERTQLRTLILLRSLSFFLFFTCCADAAGTVASQRERLAMLENSGIARAERAEKTEATLTAAATPMRLLLLLPLRRAARAAPLRTASMDSSLVRACVPATEVSLESNATER